VKFLPEARSECVRQVDALISAGKLRAWGVLNWPAALIVALPSGTPMYLQIRSANSRLAVPLKIFISG